MYGVPANLDLSRFVGATLIQICLGEYDLQFHFHPDGSISVLGHWELASGDGTVIDCATENADREIYRLHVLLGSTVVNTSIDPPRSLSMQFDEGYVLTVYDDSKQYESISIQPGDIYI
jgi:hypothetical protein